jgi:putative SOS response-associated peptidase YedK
MCGRFVSTTSAEELATYFDAEPPVADLPAASWNVAPTDDVPVVLDEDHERRVEVLHWGLVPFWAKDPSVGSRMINARAEGIAEKAAFKRAFCHRRCLVPADGFYEWRATPGQKAKQPFFIHRPDGAPFAFAGLWEWWRDPAQPDAGTLRSFTIITTTPNAPMATVHDRMPVILDSTNWDAWLDPDNRDVAGLETLLVPAPDAVTTMHPVAAAVGNVRNQGPHLVDRFDPDVPVDAAGTLFG